MNQGIEFSSHRCGCRITHGCNDRKVDVLYLECRALAPQVQKQALAEQVLYIHEKRVVIREEKVVAQDGNEVVCKEIQQRR